MTDARRDDRRFRYDINALRCLAVTIVVLFHLRVWPLQGGFIGVDVFFVISGFLMSRIIAGRIGAGRFSLLTFYADRARRIVPALLVMCCAVLLVAVTLLDPMTAATTARNAALALSFFSNVPFAFEDGYFANGSDANWLLHTWTLSVEWQFYLVFPLILMIAARVPWLWRRRFPAALLTTAVLFVVTILVSERSNVTLQLGFFLLPTRAWELLAGACVAFAPASRLAPTARLGLQIAGLALIVGSSVGLDGAVAWPSAWTVLPVLGAVAVLLADADGTRLLRAAPIQKIGLWSYSIYLWHWPVAVALRYFGVAFSGPVQCGAVLLSVALGALSYHLVELRFRDALFARSSRPMWTTARVWLVWGSITAVALGVWATQGLEHYRTRDFDPKLQAMLADYKAATRDWEGEKGCRVASRLSVGHVCQIGDPTDDGTAVIGDSHVLQLIARYGAPGRLGPGRGLTMIYRNGCPPIPDVELLQPGYKCAEFFKAAMDYVKKRDFKHLVFISAWNVYFDDAAVLKGSGLSCLRNEKDGSCTVPRSPAEYRDTVDRAFDGLGRTIKDLSTQADVTVVGIEPTLDGQTAASLYRDAFRTRHADPQGPIRAGDFAARNALAAQEPQRAAAIGGARFVAASTALCPDGLCPVYENGHFVYRDGNHIRASVIKGHRDDFLDAVLEGQNGTLSQGASIR